MLCLCGILTRGLLQQAMQHLRTPQGMSLVSCCCGLLMAFVRVWLVIWCVCREQSSGRYAEGRLLQIQLDQLLAGVCIVHRVCSPQYVSCWTAFRTALGMCVRVGRLIDSASWYDTVGCVYYTSRHCG